MNIGTFLLIVLILILIGALPVWPHGGFGAGYWPSGTAGVILIVVILVLLLRL